MERLKKIDELRRTLNELRELGAMFRGNFLLFEKAVSQEKFPEDILVNRINSDFSEWIDLTDKCDEIYDKLFGDDKPRTFSELEKILTAEEKKIIEANLFTQAERFLQLVAKTSDEQKLLEKYQKKLRPLLAKKSRDAKTQERVEAYAKFIAAMEEKDFGKKFALGKELSDIFDDDFIGRAFIGKELSFEGETTDGVAEDTTTAGIDAMTDDTTDFAEILREKDALLADADFAPFEKSLTVEDCERGREINLKRFKRDFESHNVIKLVFFTTLMSGGFSTCTIPVGSKFSKENFESVAQLLLNKGYFKKYSAFLQLDAQLL